LFEELRSGFRSFNWVCRADFLK